MRKTDVSKVANKLLEHKGFRFGIRTEIHRSLEQAKLKSPFLNWIDKKAVAFMGFIRSLDRKI